MPIHYGKRNPGALTAASPGDTLYIPLAFYNDSGASISIGSTLAVTDIEVFKNGGVAQRATDSGYAILGDTGNFDNRIGFKGVSISLYNTADDASFYAIGSTYWVAIDSVTVDGRTVRFWPAVFEIGEQRANIVQIAGDTGAANYLKNTFANGFADTGVQDNLGRIRADVDTGLRVHIDDSDTGIKDVIADLDTGLRAMVGTHNLLQVRGDTGAAQRLFRFLEKLDTGGDLTISGASIDTGQVSNAVWNSLRSQHTTSGSFGESDTGVNQRFGQIQSDVDTGLRTHINDLDTGLHDTLADYDTGVRAILALQDTGAVANAVWGFATRGITAISDTGLNDNLGRIRSDVDTGLRVHIDDLDTGLHAHISDVDTGIHSILQTTGVLVSAFSDTGVNDRLARILADTDTGIQSSVNVTGIADTGINSRFAAIQAQTDKLTFDTGNEILADIRKVNRVTVQGAGDTGSDNTWRPGT